MVISRAVVGKKIFGRQTDGVQALWKRLYPWTDYTWARLYPWTHCTVCSFTFCIFFQHTRHGRPSHVPNLRDSLPSTYRICIVPYLLCIRILISREKTSEGRETLRPKQPFVLCSNTKLAFIRINSNFF
jgi:hypothetical protein